MVELPEEARLARLRRKRVVLRAFNGAGLGALLGGLIGAAWCALTVGLAPHSILPGIFGGFWVGMTVVVRDERRGVLTGMLVGGGVGLVYALVLGINLSWTLFFALLTVPSGCVGGLVLSALMRAIRARWGWWTRWEE
jgi:hypothetical protein